MKWLDPTVRRLNESATGHEGARVNAEAAKIVGRFALALRAAEQVGAAEAGNPMAQTAVGAAYSAVGAHQKALPHFKRATLLAPDNADFVFNLGTVQQYCGDIDGAAQSFERVIWLAPNYYKAYYALVHLRRQSLTRNLLAPLERMFASPDQDGLLTLHVGHALAKTYEDLGDPKQAFAWLLKAKAKRGKLRRYSYQSDLSLAQAAIDAAGMAEGSGHPSEEPIFIVGMPRTGTTLTDRILSSHPDVSSVGELSNFPQLMSAMIGAQSKLALSPENLAKSKSLDAAALGRGYIDSTRPMTGATPRFVDKAPINYLVAGPIHRALPNARIVCIMRDPMDTVLSLFKQMFATEHPYYDYVYDLRSTARAYVNFRAVVAHLKSNLPADRFIEVRYEDIVDDLEGQARRVLAFCGLAWNDSVLSFHQNASAVSTPSAAQVRQPLYRSAVGRSAAYGDLLAPAREILVEAGLVSAN